MSDLDAILSRYPSDCRPSDIEPLGSAGGMSGAAFWRLTAPRGRLALRRWPTEHPTPERLKFIHAVLRHAAKRGVDFIPVPIATVDGATFVEHRGRLWELAPWMPGSADYERAPSVAKLRRALSALAQFHVATSTFHQSATHLAATQRVARASQAVSHRLARLHDLRSGGMDALMRPINDATWPELAPLARDFRALLPHALPRAISELAPLANTPLPLQPCLRDIWHDHVLFTGDKVTGIIDFGAVDIETPAGDIARLLGSLVGDDMQGWQTGLAAYTAIRPLSDQEKFAVTALDTSGTLLAGCNWIHWIYIEGREFEMTTQVISRFRRIVERSAILSRAAAK